MMESTYSAPFGQRVGVVEAKVAVAAVLLGHAEVEADRLGVADVQIAVRLRGKTGHDAAAVLARAEVVLDDLADEIRVPRADPVLACHTCHVTGGRRSARVGSCTAAATPGTPAAVRALTRSVPWTLHRAPPTNRTGRVGRRPRFAPRRVRPRGVDTPVRWRAG